MLAQQTFPERLGKGFQQYNDRSPQEKIYLHLDKSSYTAGENIWLKAYLTDATYHVPDRLSKYIYVELIDRSDSICQQIKLRQTDSCFYGNFRLPMDIKPGKYCIRAYTSWMMNQEELFFFKKNITLYNSSPDVHLLSDSKPLKDEIETTISLIDNNGHPYAGQRLRLHLRKGNKTVRKMNVRTNDKGRCLSRHALGDSIDNIKVIFPGNQPFSFQQTLYLPDITPHFDLQFFPEGGNLLAGTRQKIAFKAIGPDGHAIDVQGCIYNSRDVPIGRFQSIHRGMGTFTLLAEPGEKYYARASSPGKQEIRRELPLPVTEGYALKAVWRQDSSVLLSILKADAASADSSLYLFIHCRGQLIHAFPVDANFIGSIEPRQFPKGIIHFVLADTSDHIYSERLCFFIPDSSSYRLNLKTDKPIYAGREPVALSFHLPSGTAFPGGSFSVAVTDDTQVRNDSLEDNIVSYFLLSSDLRGPIEAPGSYLHESAETTDLLMLTHGWTRFNINNLLQGIFPRPQYPLELDQQLHGQVTNYNNKPMSHAKVQVFIPAQETLGEIKADANGKFSIRNIEFCDSTLFLIRGFKEKGGKQVQIRMDTLLPPAPQLFFSHANAMNGIPEEEYMKNFQGDFFYQDGIKIYILEEARVFRKRPSANLREYAGEYTDMADQLLGREELSRFSASTIFQLLMRLPGVYITGENVSIRGQGAPLFLVDGIPMEADFIGGILPDDVDNVGVIKDGARLSFFGNRGNNGVIIINTKRGTTDTRPTPGLIKYLPKGYLQPDEFYMPAYDLPEEKSRPEIDYRSTIYWHPNVIPDSTGYAKVRFFTADLPATYTITVEGISKEGNVYYSCKKIQRK